jgi:hypothetical protein
MICATRGMAVQYRVTFDATWSEANHPNAYPASAHFSSMIGGTHSDDVLFWELGGLASGGLEGVAETGSVTGFSQELTDAIDAGTAYPEKIQGRSFDSPGQQSLQFEADANFPLVTLVTMIAPSPDWFVGVSGLSLHNGDQWMQEVIVDLAAYDAGTEEGNGFSLSNPPTSPPVFITRLDQDESSPFFNSSAPLGAFRFELLPVCDLNMDGNCDADDLSVTNGLYSVGDLGQGVVAQRGVNSRFDITGDGMIDGNDLDRWLAEAATHNGFAEPYLKGDTNLNDHVGFGDFTALAENFETGREWTEGNYDGSGTTGFGDFLALAGNFGKSIARQEAAVVPEPSAVVMLLCGGLVGLLRRRRRVRP